MRNFAGIQRVSSAGATGIKTTQAALGLALTLLLLLNACSGGTDSPPGWECAPPEATPAPSPIPGPPELEARAHGQRMKLATGPVDWCYFHADAFHVATPKDPLVVGPGERVVIDYPRSYPGLGAGSVEITPADETPREEGDLLIWDDASWSYRPAERRFVGAHELTFAAPNEPARYLVVAWISLSPKPDLFSPRPEASYALLLEVRR